MSREQLLATTFVELADTTGDDFDVLDFLQNMVRRSTEILGASAAALILVDQRGELQLVASTTHAAGVLELLAIATSEGPCLDAYPDRTGRREHARGRDEPALADLHGSSAEPGLPSVHVLPMRTLRGAGAVSLLYTDPTDLDETTW